MVFQKLADYKRAPYKYRIRANIELAKNTQHDSASVLVLDRLKKLIRNSDNRKFLNALYYQAGVIEQGRNKTENAIEYFNKSLRAKTNNDYQKTYAYEQLGTMAFHEKKYTLAGKYYDSVLDHTSEEFELEKRIRRVKRRNKGLTTLRKYEETVRDNDSILKIVAMSKEERIQFFEKYIEKIEKEDEERKQEILNAQNFGSSFGVIENIGNKKKGKWYFYNAQNIAFGKISFEKVWGNRVLEDDWRLSSKNIRVEEEEEEEVSTEERINPRYELNTYLEVIPTDANEIESLKKERNDALYQLGLIYKEQFKNPLLAIEKLERLKELRKDDELELAISYHLYQLYKDVENTPKADYYKNIVLTKYGDTKFAQLIQNPNEKLIEEVKEEDEIVEGYKAIYYLYKLNKFEETIKKIDAFTPLAKNSNLIPKLALLKALAIGKYKDTESYIEALEFVSLGYASTEEGKKAKEIIKRIKNKSTK